MIVFIAIAWARRARGSHRCSRGPGGAAAERRGGAAGGGGEDRACARHDSHCYGMSSGLACPVVTGCLIAGARGAVSLPPPLSRLSGSVSCPPRVFL